MNSIFSEENLQVFVTVVQCASFSKAAIELGVTTSAVSYTIKRIETGLGVPLFVRHPRRIELTESGDYFYRKALTLLNDFGAIQYGVDAIAQGVEARVRICINHLLYTPHHTARLLQLLKKQFPTCQVTVTQEVYNGVWDAFIHHQATLAMGHRMCRWTGMALTVLISAMCTGSLRSRPIIRWPHCLSPSVKVRCGAIPILWWPTRHRC
ncbi:hypothetical protein ERHA55_12690 [Erwinia rhapontici]|nr:hypothetical protein ERHA55_12690 [Erwinia rhapontici]